MAQGQRCSTARGDFLGQGSNPGLLHWQMSSLPLSHQGSPPCYFKRNKGTAPLNCDHVASSPPVRVCFQSLSLSLKWCSCHQDPTPEGKLTPWGCYPPALETAVCFLSLWVCPLCVSYVDRRRQYRPLCLAFPFEERFQGSSFCGVRVPFLFVTEWCSILWVFCLIYPLPTEGRLAVPTIGCCECWFHVSVWVPSSLLCGYFEWSWQIIK